MRFWTCFEREREFQNFAVKTYLNKMERPQEDEEAQAARAAELNSLVWLYLRTVNDSMADAFREQTKARERGAGEPTLYDLYDCYQASKSRDNPVHGIRLKRPADLPVNILHNVRPKLKIANDVPITEIIDLTMLSDTETHEDLRHPRANNKTEIHNKVAVPGIGCPCCNPQPGTSQCRPGSKEELARNRIVDPLPESTPQATSPRLERKEEGPEPEEPQQERNNNLQFQLAESPLRDARQIEDDYRKMLELEAQQQLLPNIDAFTCGVCLCEYEAGEGVMLRECLHTFCRECLGNLVRHCDEAIVVCPHRGEGDVLCGARLEEREVRAVVTEADYEKRLQKTVRLAETQMQDAFHCRTPDCLGWCVHDNQAQVFACPLCNHTNCLKCKALHEGEDCGQYKLRMIAEEAFQGAGGAKTKDTIDKMINRKEALPCPKCGIIVIKDRQSCDWVQCSICKSEICWATRQLRWGPGGKGDTSAGCRCRVDGKLCHPRCRNCH